MRTNRLGVFTAVALGMFALAGCSDSPVATQDDATIRTAVLMEEMGAQAAQAGDVNYGAELAFLAGALRQGVKPSRFEAFTGTRWEEYNALVRVEQHMGPEPATHTRLDRSFFAWQLMGEGLHLLKVRTTGVHGDMMVNAADPGTAMYVQRVEGKGEWVGLLGSAHIQDGPVLGKCEPAHAASAAAHMVACYRAKYFVSFEVRFQPAHDEVTPQSHWLLMWARPQLVNAVKWEVNELE